MIRFSNSFVSTGIPGSYFNVEVQSSPTSAGSSGNIVIIGEADGGADFSSEILKNNYFSPDQFDKVKQKYLSGPIVEAMMALTASSNDPEITGAPNRIYIVKTNAGVKASAAISAYGSLADKNYGVSGNKYNYQITQLDSELGPSLTSTALSFVTPAIYDGIVFTARVDGGASSTITIPTGSHGTAALLAAQINSQLPVGLTCVSESLTSIAFKHSVDSSANAKGYSKSFELFDTGAVDLSALGFSNGVTKSSVEPKIQVNINRSDIALNEQIVIQAEVAMNIGYLGTSALLTINGTNFTTTVVGGAGGNLDIVLANYSTLKDLCDFINSQTGYTCSVVASSTSSPTYILDLVSAIGIATSGAIAAVGLKKSVNNFANKMVASTKLDATITATAGLPDATVGVLYLTGGLKGSTSSSSLVSGLLACEGIKVNFVIPLFSRNASDDIAEGLTDSLSTYTIDAINAAVKSHCLKMSTAKNKKHRTCFLSVWGTFINAQAKAHELANARASLAFQRVSNVNSLGVVQSFYPWMASVIAAGMTAGGIYKSIVNKLANIISYVDPSDFDSGSIGDLESALEAGLLILQPDISGIKWVSDQTSYGLDSNFVYNSISTMYNVDQVSLDLSESLQRVFTGKSFADVSEGSVIGYIISKMDIYKKSKLISASADALGGYKDLKVKISGVVIEVSVNIKSSGSILFIPVNLTISETSSSI